MRKGAAFLTQWQSNPFLSYWVYCKPLLYVPIPIVWDGLIRLAFTYLNVLKAWSILPAFNQFWMVDCWINGSPPCLSKPNFKSFDQKFSGQRKWRHRIRSIYLKTLSRCMSLVLIKIGWFFSWKKLRFLSCTIKVKIFVFMRNI